MVLRVDECLECRSQSMTNGFIAYIKTLIDVFANDIKHAFIRSPKHSSLQTITFKDIIKVTLDSALAMARAVSMAGCEHQ